MAADDDKLSTD